MEHQWMISVLNDLKSYADGNDLAKLSISFDKLISDIEALLLCCPTADMAEARLAIARRH